jgi:hypothetical protein
VACREAAVTPKRVPPAGPYSGGLRLLYCQPAPIDFMGSRSTDIHAKILISKAFGPGMVRAKLMRLCRHFAQRGASNFVSEGAGSGIMLSTLPISGNGCPSRSDDRISIWHQHYVSACTCVHNSGICPSLFGQVKPWRLFTWAACSHPPSQINPNIKTVGWVPRSWPWSGGSYTVTW